MRAGAGVAYEPIGSTSPASKSKCKVKADVSSCRYPLVRRALEEAGWETSTEPVPRGDAGLYWTDLTVCPERVITLQHQQCLLNHFPSMETLARKVPMAMNLNRMRSMFPEAYDFYPESFASFEEYDSHRRDSAPTKANATPQHDDYYISKLTGGCMGRGITVTKTVSRKNFSESVVQRYVDRPLLIEGKKCDLRCYVLVVSVDPLKIFFSQEGLVRLCATSYEAPTEANCGVQSMHLANYAINKDNPNYVPSMAGEDGYTGNKRNFKFLNGFLLQRDVDVAELWHRIHSVCVKAVLSVYPQLLRTYHTCMTAATEDGHSGCFEVLGVDILLDEQQKPWLLEVNHSPSWQADTALDADIKFRVLKEALLLAQARPQKKPRRRWRSREDVLRKHHDNENGIMDTFVRIFPTPRMVEELAPILDFQQVIVDLNAAGHYNRPASPKGLPVLAPNAMRRVRSTTSGDWRPSNRFPHKASSASSLLMQVSRRSSATAPHPQYVSASAAGLPLACRR